MTIKPKEEQCQGRADLGMNTVSIWHTSGDGSHHIPRL